MTMTLRNLLRAPLAAALLLSLTACPSVTDQINQLTTSDPGPAAGPPAYVYPALAPAEAEEVPGDLKAIAGAVAQRLYGTAPKRVRRTLGVVNSELVEPRKDFPLDGFRVVEVQYLDARATSKDTKERQVTIVLNFRDAYYRGASAKAVVAYKLKGKKRVDMTRAAWTPVTPAMPVFETFVVPHGAMKASKKNAGQDYRSFYNAVVKAAIPRHQVAQRIEEGGDFVIASFGKTPMGRNARLAMEISESHDGPPANTSGGVSAAVYPGRYPVMLFPVSLQSAPGKPLWVRLIHTPGEEAGDTARSKPILVDLFPLAEDTPSS